MRITWFGQSAFSLTDGNQTVFIDPFGDMSAAAARGMQFDYPPIKDVHADLLLVTHEHADHNVIEAVSSYRQLLRSTAGTFEQEPFGKIIAINSEHDDVAGTRRGPNTMFVFPHGGLRICHMGDFGQQELRRAQRDAMGQVDLLFIPVGGGPTIGAEQAAAIVAELKPSYVVPMHYRTTATNFLEPVDAFAARMHHVSRLPSSTHQLVETKTGEPQVLIFGVPT